MIRVLVYLGGGLFLAALALLGLTFFVKPAEEKTQLDEHERAISGD